MDNEVKIVKCIAFTVKKLQKKYVALQLLG